MDVVPIGGERGVLAPEVGTKQLISTIQEVKTHGSDPTTGEATDPWDTVQDEFGDLGRRLKDTYAKVASEGGPSEEEIKDAFGTLLGAWNQVAESVTTALENPEVRQHLKAAAGSLASALGNTINDLGAELRDAENGESATAEGEAGADERGKSGAGAG